MSGYFWLISANIFIAALAAMYDAKVFAGAMAVFCLVMAAKRFGLARAVRR